MMDIDHHFELMGHVVKDKVTGWKGVVVSICFDLYGCVMADVKPQELTDDGKTKEGAWFDLIRLEKISTCRVIDIPDFSRPKTQRHKQSEFTSGPSEKSAR